MSGEKKLRPHEVRGPSDPLSADTDPEIERRQLEIYRNMSAGQKIQLVDQLWVTARTLGMAGLRQRYPEAGEQELLYRWAALVYGEDLARRAYGAGPFGSDRDPTAD